MSKQASEFREKVTSFLFRGKEIFKPLNTGYIDERVGCVREYVANIFFYTKNGTTIMIDAGYSYLMKAFDIIFLDWFLLTKSHFFQHYYFETEGCAGYHHFGFNRRQQMGKLVLIPFCSSQSSMCQRAFSPRPSRRWRGWSSIPKL